MTIKTIRILASAALFLAACSPAKLAAVPTPTAGPPMPGCQVSGLLPDTNPTMTASVPPIRTDDHILGNQAAKVTILEYGDFQ
jgi:hypothetical protein